MTTWAEIKHLASQLKNVQAAESANFISERTCVDILSHLFSSGRLDLIRTLDGRSLMTNKELDKEILEELEAHGGHVSLLEVAEAIDVDYSYVESRAHEIVSGKREDIFYEPCLLVGGDLLTKRFVRKIAEDIKDRFDFRGFINTVELTRMFTFPPSFITTVISEYNGQLFKIHHEGDKYYTDSFLSKLKSKIRGFLSGTVIPVTISSVSSKLDINAKLLVSLIDTLISDNKLQGSLTTGRSIYSPLCYSCAQEAYVKSFFSQNSYIEFSLVKRIGISDPVSYIRSQFPSAICAKEFAISDTVVSQIKSLILDESHESMWIDVTHYLPQSFGPKEREWLITPLLKNTHFLPFVDFSFLCLKNRIDEYLQSFDEFIREEAALAAVNQRQASKTVMTPDSTAQGPQGKIFSEKKTKSSGIGSRGREIKTKNVKNKYLKKQQDYNDVSNKSDDEESEIQCEEHLPKEKLFSILSAQMTDEVPNELVYCLLDYLLPDIKTKFLSLKSSILLQNSSTSKNRDRFLAEKDSFISALLSIQLLERGALAVDDATLREQLIRHLIRSDVSTFVNRLLIFLAQNYDVTWPTSTIASTATVTTKKAPPGGKVKGGHRGKKNKASPYDYDDEVEEAEEPSELVAVERAASVPASTVYSPSDITGPQRDMLAILLRKLSTSSSEPTVEAAEVVAALNTCLRANPVEGDLDGRLPLDEVFSLCDNLASSHLGFNLSVSVLRAPRSDSKRKKQDRALAQQLAIQTEQQVVQATDEASLALAVSAMFGHALVGWPLLVHGKLVPALSIWIQKRLKASKGSEFIYSELIKELKACQAGDDLIALKDIVLSKAKGDVDVSEVEIKALMERLSSAAIKCRKLMQPGIS